jgi:hypothetical protein
MTHTRITEALQILNALGMPKGQQNDRTALCLLALLHLTPDKDWAGAEAPYIGITPMMDFSKAHYGRHYAPNTRETFRRFSMHQLVEAGIARYNPDDPARPVNSPKAVYQVAPEALTLLRTFGSGRWETALRDYLSTRQTLAAQYAREREGQRIPVQIAPGEAIKLTPGAHSILIKAVIETFAPRFVPGAKLVYAGDTGAKWGYFDEPLLAELGVQVDAHGKMPDVVLYYPGKQWLILVESVTSHGPVDGKRRGELATLFKASKAGLVFVTAFPTRALMARYVGEIAWETEVWVAEAPSHLIHFNGDRFLGPYQ